MEKYLSLYARVNPYWFNARTFGSRIHKEFIFELDSILKKKILYLKSFYWFGKDLLIGY